MPVTRSRKAGDQTQFDRVFCDGEHNRNRRSCRFCCERRLRGAGGDNYSHASTDKVGDDLRQTIVTALQPMVIDRGVLTLDIAGFPETVAERGCGRSECLCRPGLEEPDHRQCRLLLCPRRHRPRRRRNADQRDKIAPLQSIELHLVPQPAPGQHIALVRSSRGLAALRKFNPANVSNGSKPEVTAVQKRWPVHLSQRT